MLSPQEMSLDKINSGGYIPLSNKSAPTVPVHRKPIWRHAILGALGFAALTILTLFHGSRSTPMTLLAANGASIKDRCAQADVLIPNNTSPALDAILPEIASGVYRKLSIDYLSGAVQIPTITHDNMGVPGKDERFEIFYKFARYLEKTFPLTHDVLALDKVNTHGLVYTWKGSDGSLKPTLLMAHQDVVPVPAQTIPTWTHPPFAGVFDGTYIWGRGSSDCKNQLIAILESVELLLKADFKPRRTVILSFGFDEEVGGLQGAGHLAPLILERYGKDSIAVIIDEGMKMQELWGALVAQPGVAEKGAVDIKIVIRMPGGHSSVPPPHTSIGVLSELIQLIETSTYPTYLDALNPYYSTILCGAVYAPDFPPNLRKLLARRSHSKQSDSVSCMGKDHLAEEAAKESLFHKYLMTTSIAVDVISGGEKSNALPEEATVVINHRVNIGDSVSLVKSKIRELAKQVATKYNLTLHAYDNITESSSIMLSAPQHLDTAPVTPSIIDPISAWSVLSGTTRAQYGTGVIMTPGLMTGNTDTRFYWDLTRDIFRYGPGFDGDGDGVMGGIHTVNERVSIKDHIETIKWFVQFIRNMDEARLA